MHRTDRQQAQDWARQMLAAPDTIILDTETTGLDGRAEVVQVAAITVGGQVLIDALVRPTRLIPPEATRIHRITDAQVADAPTFAELAPHLREILKGARVVIYNAAFDTRILEQSARAHGLSYEVPIFGADYVCAMESYSAWRGDWSEYHGNYRWQRLPGGDHTALGDCRATLAVLRRMAGEGVADVS